MSGTSTEALRQALDANQIDLPEEQLRGIERYCRLLWQWNEKLNLTRHTDFEKFVSRDLIDCLQLSQLLEKNETVLDIGSGGGVPGVVLALLRPDLQISLSESVGKKAVALEAIVEALELPVPVHACRSEKVLEHARFDTLVARAVGPLWKQLKWIEPHWEAVGRLLTVKGPRWPQERGEARHRGYLRHLNLRRAATYPMPATGAESVILQIWPKEDRPGK